MKKSVVIFLIVMPFLLASQRFADQIPQIKRYQQSEVYDSLKGICIYDKLIESIGGDSVKFNKAGYNLQGWNEDFYTNGKTLHKGYYVDGKVIVFKNFYENGQVERSFISPDPLHCTMEIFYENGFQKKKILYYDGKPQKQYEFYDNGQPKLTLENEKEMKYITLKKTWYSNGQLEGQIEINDKKGKKFSEKKFYKNGQLKEEGALILSEDGANYLKDGTWTYYDENGKRKKTEKFKQN